MAAKRLLDDSGDGFDQPNQKKMKNTPSFASVIKEVVMVNFVQNFCSALEPMLRRVVNEEMESGLRKCSRSIITRSPSLRIHGPESSSLHLIFSKQLSLPIFTGSKIVDIYNNPLQIILVDTNGDGKVPITLPYPIKIEIVVLDGDFPATGDGEKWTDDEFQRYLVKERTGKRPLLTGDLNVTMRDGYACLGDLEFTDNSSWIRSRRFRVAAKVVHGTTHGVRIRGAITESFIVKDHRGELYKKHHPPGLGDEVWRLEKIGKEGAFHRKLSSAGVKTVQDFLKLSIVEPPKLRRILGNGMSDKMWEITIKHARTCVMGNKFYILRGNNYALTLNPICQVVKAHINGHTYPTRDLVGMHKAYIENLVRDAYTSWDSLEEVDGPLNETALLTQGDLVDQYQNQQHQQQQQQQTMVKSSYRRTNESAGVVPMMSNNEQQLVGSSSSDWIVNAGYLCSPVIDSSGVRYFSESSSDNDLH